MDYTFAGLPLPLRILPASPMTDEEIMRFCARNEGLPVERDEDGYLWIMTPAGSRTSNKNAYISRMLDTWAEETDRGLAFDSNGGFTLPDTSMRAPDAAWVSAERWNQLSAADQAPFAPVTPEFVIELRPPSDSLNILQRKMDKWIANGTELAWLIDPLEKAVTVYRPHTTPEHLEAPSQVTGEGPVAGFILPLERIFS